MQPKHSRLLAAGALCSMLAATTLHCSPRRRPALSYNQAMARYEKAMAQVRKQMAEAEKYKKLADTLRSPSMSTAPAITPVAREKSAQEKIMLKTPQTTYSPDYLEAHAKKLQTEAGDLDSVHPMNLGASGMQKIEDYRLIAAALRSHAQQVKNSLDIENLQKQAEEERKKAEYWDGIYATHPMQLQAAAGSFEKGIDLISTHKEKAAALQQEAQGKALSLTITEDVLLNTTPNKLEALAAKLEKEKIALEQTNQAQQTLQNLERKRERKKELDAEISALHAQAQVIRAIPNTPITIDVNFLENLAKNLQTEADDLNSTHPMNLSASSEQKMEDCQLIAAALRSHAQQMRVPNSPITEYKLQTTMPSQLEALAAKLEQEKNALDQKNPEHLSLQDHTRKRNLQAEITALRAQAQLILKAQK
jgi:hypothetical protein